MSTQAHFEIKFFSTVYAFVSSYVLHLPILLLYKRKNYWQSKNQMYTRAIEVSSLKAWKLQILWCLLWSKILKTYKK